MKPPARLNATSLVIGVLLLAACGSSSGGGGGGSGNGGSTTGTGGNGTGGGAGPGTGGTATGSGGTATGAGGTAAGTGGTVTGAGGMGGAVGAGGVAGGGAAGAGAGDDFVSGVNVAVHPQTSTILVVTWTQARAAESVWLEFTFAGNATPMTSRPAAGATGAHRDVVLGVPSMTAVTVRIVSRQTGVDNKTRDYMGTTGALPTNMPRPMVMTYNAALASPDRWMFGSVEDSMGGCTTRNCYFSGGLFYVYIMDRMGRIVWYYVDASSNAATGFQRIARDGEYIWIERARTGTRGVTKMTLDRQYMQAIAVPGLADAIDVTSDGALLYDANSELREMNRAGTIRTIWSCTAFGMLDNCYSNVVNWSEADNTVLMSFPETNTVVQINRATGAVVATYGDRTGSYTFSPATRTFEWQHFPNITPQGTLIVSTHLTAFPEGSSAGANQHAFVEFDIDRTGRRLVERWSYTGAYWPLSRGMAIKLSNGNVLANYGTGGIIQEITPNKEIAFQVKFDVPTGNDFANKMVGHNVLINDLYALNGGGPR